MKKLLFIVDPQYDFIEGGKLAVNGAQAKMDALADYIKTNSKEYSNIVITADSHPFTHCSFKENGGEWPSHCIANTHGSSIYESVIINAFMSDINTRILTKGTEVGKDEYSIFQNKENGIKLREFLAEENFEEIHVCGICGDVCVLNTINDMVELLWGNTITVLKDFTPSIDGGTKLTEYCEKNGIKMI